MDHSHKSDLARHKDEGDIAEEDGQEQALKENGAKPFSCLMLLKIEGSTFPAEKYLMEMKDRKV